MTTQLEHITTVCGAGSCPTVYKRDDSTVVVQGYALPPAENGESVIEIPADLLAEYARHLAETDAA